MYSRERNANAKQVLSQLVANIGDAARKFELRIPIYNAMISLGISKEDANAATKEFFRNAVN